MKEYSDYVRTTQEYLKHYREFEITIENLEDEIKAQEVLLRTAPAAPVPKYEGTVGGGSELTAVESEASRRIAIADSIESKRREIMRIKTALRKVDRALKVLTPDERGLVIGHFMDRESWRELSVRYYMTEKWARVTAGKIIKRLAGMIFGSAAIPEQQSLFVFFE